MWLACLYVIWKERTSKSFLTKYCLLIACLIGLNFIFVVVKGTKTNIYLWIFVVGGLTRLFVWFIPTLKPVC